jgi:putative ABC transport system permease protein
LSGSGFTPLRSVNPGAEDPAEETWSGVRFFFRDRSGDLPDRVAALRAKLIACCDEFLDITSGEALRRGILKVFDETFAITFVLLIIALVVAALGVATTLTVLVLERSRQLNTLIAVGADRGQIRAMIFWEALLLTAAGEALGLACGVALSWLLVYVINYQSFGWTFIYAVDWGMLGLSVPLIVGVALGAAIPAVRAAFRDPVAMVFRGR